jgi:hypothetical protein
VEKAIGGGCEGRVQLLEQPGKPPRYFLSKDHPYHHDGLRYTVVYVDVRIRVRASVRWDDHDPLICTSVYIGVFRYTPVYVDQGEMGSSRTIDMHTRV